MGSYTATAAQTQTGGNPTTKTTTIPLVDFSDFTPDNPTAKARIARELVAACRDVGFVYITNHGVPQDTLAKAFEVSKKFYDLPLEDKMKAPHPPGWAVHRGYSWPGLEKVSAAISEADHPDQEAVERLREVQDFKESYEIGSESNTEQPNIWPPDDVYPEWRSFMTSFYWTCFEAAAKNILRALAIGIGLPHEDDLLKLHSGHYNQLRLLHYPPIPAAALIDDDDDNNNKGGKFARMPAHTDWSSITLLFQDDCGGLQVEGKGAGGGGGGGHFIDVPPIPGALVMNVGDLLMRWTNDYLKSTSHRVGLPPLQDRFSGEERMTRARYSIPYFLTTDPDCVIECLRVGDGGEQHSAPPKYQPITQRQYAAMRARMQYQSADQEAAAAAAATTTTAAAAE